MDTVTQPWRLGEFSHCRATWQEIQPCPAVCQDCHHPCPCPLGLLATATGAPTTPKPELQQLHTPAWGIQGAGGGDLGEGGGGEERGERERAATSGLLSVSAPLSPTVKEIPRQLGSGEAIHLHKHPSSSLLLETTDRVSLVAARLPEGSLIKSHFSETAKPRPSHLPRRQGQVSLEGTEAGGGRRGEAGSAGVGLPTPGYRAVQGSGPEVNGKAVGQRSFRGLREWTEHL